MAQMANKLKELLERAQAWPEAAEELVHAGCFKMLRTSRAGISPVCMGRVAHRVESSWRIRK
jgi:hypothetical protein